MSRMSQVSQAGEPGRSSAAAWGAEDWRAYFDERAAIAEHDGGQDRAVAERVAFECTVAAWLNRHPPLGAAPERCVHCGAPELVGRPLLPALAGDGGHVSVHDRCHGEWIEQRRAEAAAALARMGIVEPWSAHC